MTPSSSMINNMTYDLSGQKKLVVPSHVKLAEGKWPLLSIVEKAAIVKIGGI